MGEKADNDYAPALAAVAAAARAAAASCRAAAAAARAAGHTRLAAPMVAAGAACDASEAALLARAVALGAGRRGAAALDEIRLQESVEGKTGVWPRTGADAARFVREKGPVAAAQAARRIVRRGGKGRHGAQPPLESESVRGLTGPRDLVLAQAALASGDEGDASTSPGTEPSVEEDVSITQVAEVQDRLQAFYVGEHMCDAEAQTDDSVVGGLPASCVPCAAALACGPADTAESLVDLDTANVMAGAVAKGKQLEDSHAVGALEAAVAESALDLVNVTTAAVDVDAANVMAEGETKGQQPEDSNAMGASEAAEAAWASEPANVMAAAETEGEQQPAPNAVGASGPVDTAYATDPAWAGGEVLRKEVKEVALMWQNSLSNLSRSIVDVQATVVGTSLEILIVYRDKWKAIAAEVQAARLEGCTVRQFGLDLGVVDVSFFGLAAPVA